MMDDSSESGSVSTLNGGREAEVARKKRKGAKKESKKSSKKSKKKHNRKEKKKKGREEQKKERKEKTAQKKERKKECIERNDDSKDNSEKLEVPDSQNSVKKQRRLAMVPMRREEYEAQQSVVREILDLETGRMRLVKGSGEIIERIVSKEEHARINAKSTLCDGSSFMTAAISIARYQQR
uniref:ADP-ribosylation factor-like protein 6-interacting protein 4 n=1 Tax=Heterosigma akashiwo TaxID=2829 RepID=A0A7S3Y5I9_HETAK